MGYCSAQPECFLLPSTVILPASLSLSVCRPFICFRTNFYTFLFVVFLVCIRKNCFSQFSYICWRLATVSRLLLYESIVIIHVVKNGGGFLYLPSRLSQPWRRLECPPSSYLKT